MVTTDPCDRLNTIQNQLVPGILKNAEQVTPSDTSDIRSAIEKNLPDLEKNCYELSERCKKKWPECGKEIELCNKERIRDLFQETREELEKIWEELLQQEKLETENI